ncbi:hypothetical protein HK104_005354, partial [Borealophlyctis nickersoniae]
MKLVIGQVVIVIHAYDDGWVYAKNPKTSAMGLVPRNFLKLNDSPSQPTTPPQTSTVTTRKPVPTDTTTAAGSGSPPAAYGPPPLEPLPVDQQQKPLTLPRSSSVALREQGSSEKLESVAAPAVVPASSSPNPPTTPLPGALKSKASSDSLTPLAASMSAAPAVATPVVTLEDAKEKLQRIKESRTKRARVPANIGAVKIAVVGDSGIGKTTLIHTLATHPTLYTSPLPPITPTLSLTTLPTSSIAPADLQPTEPPHNITFLDTPGHGLTVDALHTILPTIHYLQSQFQFTSAAFTDKVTDEQLVRFLSAPTGTHTHVDVCLYGLLHRVTPVDIEYMKRLALFVPIVPVLVKCDTLTTRQVFKLKLDVLHTLRSAGIDVEMFGMGWDECVALAQAKVGGAVPFAVASDVKVEEEERGKGRGEVNELEE